MLFRENKILILTVVRLRLCYFMINNSISLFIPNKADFVTEDRLIGMVTLTMSLEKSPVLFIFIL